MREHERFDVIVIGGGVAGMATALWCHRLQLRTLLLERQTELGGQLGLIKNVIQDYPGRIYENGEALQRRFAQHLDRLQVPYQLQRDVKGIDIASRLIITDQGQFQTDYLVLATGAKMRRLGIPGEESLYRRGELYSTSDPDILPRFAGKRVLIIGGGDRAFEGAYRLLNVASSVQIIHRNRQLRARREYVKPVLQHPDVTLRLEHVCQRIEEGPQGKIAWIEGPMGVLKREAYDLILIRIGVEPYLPFQLPGLARDEKGRPLINRYGQTTLPWVYAVGDLVNPPPYSSIAHGVGQGMVAAKHLLLQWEKAREYDDI